MHVLITGANRGIGKALADRYASAGAKVTGTQRAAGGALHSLDVTDPAAIMAPISAAVTKARSAGSTRMAEASRAIAASRHQH